MADFHCDGAAFFFHDKENKRITIRFLDSEHPKDSGILGFSGVVQADGTTLKVSSLYYMDPNGRPMPAASDSSCKMYFEKRGPVEIHCYAHYESSSMRYMGTVHFIAARQ